ncbi:hypothetical protein Dimus_034227 [Dionaea muscipula]
MVMMFIIMGSNSMMGEKGLAQAQAQAQAHSSCGNTFFSALVQLIPCRASVTPYSPIPPTDTCCSAIKALGQPCLCVLVNGPYPGSTAPWLLCYPTSAWPTLDHVKWPGSEGRIEGFYLRTDTNE